MSTVNNTVIVGQRDEVSFGIGPLFCLIAIIAFAVMYFWQIVAIAGVMFVASVLWMLFRDQQLRAQELAVRADEQNQQVLQGDLRGMYGDEHEGFEQR